MKKRSYIFILCVAALILLAACTKAECKQNADCTGKPVKAYTAACADKKCVYTPIPNVCGNGKCEAPGEEKGNCAQDCGTCAGKVPNSQYLEYAVIGEKCIEDVLASNIQPVYTSADVPSAGDKFKLDTVYNRPFNLKKDAFAITITLGEQAQSNRDEHLLGLELTAVTKDKRTITLARQDINKYLWTVGSTIQEYVILDFPSTELEGELSNVALKIQYEYSIVQGGKKTVKQSTLQNRYKEKLTFVRPSSSYPCPTSCDDKNPGTRDTCGPQTGLFCKHEPIPNACGNFKCDGAENKCTCSQDCGLCSGSAGNFLDFNCQASKCITVLKEGTSIQPNALFHEPSLGPVQLQNNYKYPNPFDIKADKFQLDFTVYKQDPTVSKVILETVRLLEGQQQIAEASVNKELTDKPTAVTVSIPHITDPEEDHQFTIAVWYHYIQDDKEKPGRFEKPLGKITLINPG